MGVNFTNFKHDNCDAVVKLTKRELKADAVKRSVTDEILVNSEPEKGYSLTEPIMLPRFDLPEKYCIYTRGPFRSLDPIRDEELLAIWYSRCLELAYVNHCSTVLIPLISNSTYPKDMPIQVAYDTCNLFLKQKQSDMTVNILMPNHYLLPVKISEQERKVLLGKVMQLLQFSSYVKQYYRYDPEANEPSEPDIPEDIEENSVKEKVKEEPCLHAVRCPDKKNNTETGTLEKDKEKKSNVEIYFQIGYSNVPDKDDLKVEETFREMLLRLMNEKEMTAPEIYTKACMDRKLFSKIQSSDDYQPRKYTVVRLALALELSLDETNEFMNNAGFALSRGKIKDLVIAYCIRNDMKSVSAVNEILEEWGITTI